MPGGKITGMVLLGALFAGAVEVDVNLDVRHVVGGISELDRETYFVLHASAGENTWGSAAQEATFLNGYDVYLGRSNGTLPWNLRATTEDPAKPGWCDHSQMLTRGNTARSSYASDTHAQSLESRAARMMIGGQMSMYPNGQTNASGFAVTEYDALADFYENFLTYFYGTGGTDGAPKPTMVEVLNEPFVAASSYGTTRENISRLHTNVAAAIHNSHPDVMVGGYCAAHPQYEGTDGNFSHWDSNWKTFIDIAGEQMDFFSLHLYDNPSGSTNVLDTQYRSGSNVEALLDMIEHYSMLTLGEIKPFNISEFGSLAVADDIPYDPKNDWVDVRSYSTILMQLLERPDRMIQTIPFMMVQAEWGRSDNGYPYPTRLLYDADELTGSPKDNDGPFVFTERIKYWQLWSDVRGTRVDTIASDPDIQTDAYVDGTNVFVIVSSLDHTGPQTVDLNLFGGSLDADTIEVKCTYADSAGNVILDQYATNELTAITLPASSTAVIKYVFSGPVVQSRTSIEKKYYATSYLQPISAGSAINFSITNVNVSALYGEVVLRLGIGRAHGLSLQPTLMVNGTVVPVPVDFRGYDQLTRDQFFGVIEIPVDYELLQSNNTVSVQFGDTGGHVSSVALQVFGFDSDIRTRAKMIPIDSMSTASGQNLVLNFSRGPANSWFELHTKTSLLDATWTVARHSLPIDALGRGAVTNAMDASQGFFRIVEGTAPGISVLGFVMDPASDTVGVGGTCRLYVTVSPTNAVNQSIIWTSSDPAVATVSGGVVTGVSAGSATITAEISDGGFSDSCAITVGSSSPKVSFDDANNYKNQTFTNGTFMTVKCTYDAGAGHTVTQNGVTYLLRHIDASSGSWSVVEDYEVVDGSAVGFQSGGSQADLWLPSNITPSDRLPTDHFYYLFLKISSSDGAIYSVGTQPILIVNPDLAPVVQFTSPNYSDGALDGQQNWNAEAGWSITNSTGSGAVFTAVNNEIAVLNQPVQLSVGETYSLSINLQFEGTYATPSGYVYTFLAGLTADNSASAHMSTGGTAADANIQLYGGVDKYRLLNNYSVISGASAIAGVLNAGDILQFDFELTLGSDAASTTYTVRLQNLTDGDDTGPGTVTGVDTSIYSALVGSGAYGFIQSIAPGSNSSGLSGVQVNSVLSD